MSDDYSSRAIQLKSHQKARFFSSSWAVHVESNGFRRWAPISTASRRAIPSIGHWICGVDDPCNHEINNLKPLISTLYEQTRKMHSHNKPVVRRGTAQVG